MAIFALIFLTIALILIGVGLAVGLVICGVIAMLTFFGVLTSSAAVGVWLRNPSAALRLMVYQFCVLAGLVAGVGLAWVVSLIFELHLQPAGIVLCGGLAGAASGLIFAAGNLWIFKMAHDLLWRRVSRSLAWKG
jgi:hypothetical protein